MNIYTQCILDGKKETRKSQQNGLRFKTQKTLRMLVTLYLLIYSSTLTASVSLVCTVEIRLPFIIVELEKLSLEEDGTLL